MSWWQTLLATAAGGVIAVVGGVMTQLLVAKHERERETETWKRERTDLRADAQRAAILELQDAVRDFRESMIRVAISNGQRQRTPEDDDAYATVDLNFNTNREASLLAQERMRVATSRVTDGQLREAADRAGDALRQIFDQEDLWAIYAAAQMADPELAAVDERVTHLLDTL